MIDLLFIKGAITFFPHKYPSKKVINQMMDYVALLLSKIKVKGGHLVFINVSKLSNYWGQMLFQNNMLCRTLHHSCFSKSVFSCKLLSVLVKEAQVLHFIDCSPDVRLHVSSFSIILRPPQLHHFFFNRAVAALCFFTASSHNP